MAFLPYLHVACVLVLAGAAWGDEVCEGLPPETAALLPTASLQQNSRQEGEVSLLQTFLQTAHQTQQAAHRSDARLDSFSLGSDLWSGMDSVIDNSGLSLLSTSSPDSHPKLDHFAVMGLYNTGTNLLHHLLVKNFGSQLSSEKTDLTPAKKGCWFWKHSSLSLLKSRSPVTLEGCNGSIVGLAMIRNPLSWLHSMRREAYDLRACANDHPDWLERKCRYPNKTPQRTLANEEFSNIEAIYTKWTHDYESLASFGFNRSLLIRYEDLVMDTEGVLSKIASLANLSLPANGIVQVKQAVHPSATRSEKFHERELAIQHIQSKSYLKLFDKKMLAAACARLDRDTMRRHGYTDCDNMM